MKLPRFFVIGVGARRNIRLLALLPTLFGTSCTPTSESLPLAAGAIGEPLAGLTAAELDRFERGRAIFRRMFTQEEGLGPRFNENSCNACHTFPADGGSGETSVTKRTALVNDQCDMLSGHGGDNVRKQVTSRAAELGARPVRDVTGATHTAVFSIPFIFGLGLVDAVPAAALEALADPDDSDGDGISGRVGRDAVGRPARFGRKADVASLADFNDSAFRLEMGLTTSLFPDEARAGGTPSVPAGADPTPEPEVADSTLDLVTDFVRYLTPVAPADSDDPLVSDGEALFDSLGCASCHVPELTTGPHSTSALSEKRFALFSDLLLHDLGPDLAGTCGPGASLTEYRTEPLMGLRYRDLFLHDGRATSVIEAVLAHGGEAAAARARFAALGRLRQEAVLRYLGTL